MVWENVMRWSWLLLLMVPWAAHADTIYLCKAYSGGMFWSSVPCSQKQATMDRAVTVPDDMPWDQKVAMGEAAWAQARGITAAQQQPVVVQQQLSQSTRNAECANLAQTVLNLDAQSRQPQSGQMQDWIKERRKEARDRQYKLQC